MVNYQNFQCPVFSRFLFLNRKLLRSLNNFKSQVALISQQGRNWNYGSSGLKIGIVADSSAEREFEETEEKARGWRTVLAGLTHGGQASLAQVAGSA